MKDTGRPLMSLPPMKLLLSQLLLVGLSCAQLATAIQAQSQPGSQLPALAPRAADVQPAANLMSLEQQHQQQQHAPGSLQAQLGSIQSQAQRQFSQLNGLVLSGASHLANSSMLEALSNVGKAIQRQIQSSGQIQIITSGAQAAESANSKKNEYQPLEAGLAQAQPSQTGVGQQNVTSPNQYREQGEVLRQEIVRRASQLQQVVASSMDVLKNNGDLIVRQLLQRMNDRLDVAKSKADRIINEPATNEVAIKALASINQGLNNLNSMITNIVNRLENTAKENAQMLGQRTGAASQQQPQVASNLNANLLDPTRFKLNFHQLGQQFSSALNAVQQQRLAQQQQAGNGNPNNVQQQTAQQVARSS